ncbi:hypothetical protein LRS06_07140 [Hymenobacter sp. J193]|uniref:phage/plasmid replication domain-containing protein n=1 Tax=Hymenobacter sp. J193 TaxID=2898429 RepID=UPI0021514C22|nr:phage/plasmid replication protein [Hymenobacter sp. J193]MCR5887554.1 hypothetical protein [Hymenobacter sp. J193]
MADSILTALNCWHGCAKATGLQLNNHAAHNSMVDSIRFVGAESQLPQWLQAEFASQLDTSASHLLGATVAQRRVSLTVGNINIRRNALGEVIFENSLHRFYHSHNGGLFGRRDIEAAIHLLSDTLGFDVSACELRRVDIGLNVVYSTPKEVQSLLRAVTDYKGKPFTRWERGNAITSARRDLTHFSVKFYDKRYELVRKRLADIPSTLRVELTSNRPARTRQLGACTVSDLCSLQFLTAAGTSLVNSISACGFSEPLDWSQLSPDEMEAVALVSNAEVFAAYKANRANKDRCSRRRKLAEQARQKAALLGIKSQLLTKVQEAIQQVVE